MGIQAAILDAGKLAEAISKVMQLLSALNPDRAVILEVQNQTSQTLRLVSHDHTDGGFAELPSTEIPAGTADVFGSRDTSLTSGTKGKVTYESSDGYLLTIDWDNPVSGPNRCHAQVLGSNAGNFETQAITGAGNTAHMQFTVRPGMMSRRPVRKGSLTAGAVSTDIALVNNGPRGVITAIRAGDETLKRLFADEGVATGASISG